MAPLKKLTFAPLFLISFGLLLYHINPLFASYNIIFSLTWESFIQLVVLSSLITLTSFLFILFSSLAQDSKIILPVGAAAATISLVITPQPLSFILAVGIFISTLISYLTLEGKLKSYLTFEPNSLLGPSIRHLSGLLILVISLTFFLSTNKIIQEKGFQIPDSLIDAALKVSGQSQSETTQQSLQPQLTNEQITLLKKNPELLKQYGLDSKTLDSLNQPTTQKSGQEFIKQTIKDQLQNLLKPYLGIIPALLAFLFFLSLQSLTSILTILIYPLLWITFYILEKTNFVKFEVEQRPVRKMVI